MTVVNPESYHLDREAVSSNGDANRGIIQKIGIISGAGPEAGLDLLQKLFKVHRKFLGPTGYTTDRDAPHVVLFQEPELGGPRNDNDLSD